MKTIEGGWPEGTTFTPTMPGNYYNDPQHFNKELEEIWLKSWLLIGREEEIPNPGDYFTKQIVREHLVCVRTKDGSINTFCNVCRHRGSILCTGEKGRLNNARIVCPYHSWVYSGDTGQLLSCPNVPESDANFAKNEHPLVRVPTQVWDGFIWINLDPDCDSLEQSFNLPQSWSIYERYNLQHLRIGEKKKYTVQANWKLIMENAAECYHCPNIHPELSRCTPPFKPREWTADTVPDTKVFKNFGAMELRDSFERAGLDGKVHRPLFPDLLEEDKRRIYYLHIFPHCYFGLASDYVFLATLFPISAEQTEVVAYWLFESEVLDNENYSINDAVDIWDITSRQDWKASELAHLGNRTKMYLQGGILTPLDWRVDHFKKYVLSELNYA